MTPSPCNLLKRLPRIEELLSTSEPSKDTDVSVVKKMIE